MNADPIADMLTRIRNANKLRYEEVSMPTSKMKEGIAEILKNQGFITSYRLEENEGKKTLVIVLKYSSSGERVITGLKRISKPGLRIYSEADKIPSVLKGLGIAIVSTPNGLLTDHQARKQHVGGEILCYVW
ncbi:MAG: 30S ribosomal protein S8 [Bacillales bacterium]|nr:30S ribosomal protein S8 [Mollicutes bacterium]MCI7213855.1 30S ribosomal protein S8 [Bacillales bacterium]MDY3904162.1 30S ribosomal protein S8 [Candidatus Enteromonas sp.]MCI7058703.1 30S ribosomal protein S8 [Mollicutes bacterium]MDD7715745.1 30S ribosomal protein S8 [Mollicutes bacterium]